MKVASSNRSRKIDQIEVTDDTLTSRGGLALFGRFLENTGFLDLLGHVLAPLQKSAKGKSARFLCKQLLCAFADGRGDTMMDFSALRQDPAQASILKLDSGDFGRRRHDETLLPEVQWTQMALVASGVAQNVPLAAVGGKAF